jgi:glutamate dehydrogenase
VARGARDAGHGARRLRGAGERRPAPRLPAGAAARGRHIAVAADTGGDVVAVARTYVDLGERLGLEWLEQEVLQLPAVTRVQRWAQQALLDDVLDARRVLSQKALEEAGPGADPAAAVDAFLAEREAPRRRLTTVARALRAEGDGDLAGLTLAVRHLRGLAG